MKKIVKNIIRGAAFLALLAILLLLMISGASAQGSTHRGIEYYGPVGVDGSVVIRGLEMVESGDSLLLAFSVEVSRRAINNRQSWRIVPELSSDDKGILQQFPTLLITGRQKERHFKRKERFGNEWSMANYPGYKATIPTGTDTVLNYRTAIPYQYWMDSAALSIHQYLASPK
ncbi:MAG: DUF3868 domain-containing protein, partial [Alistipes sp.]|nr:DUF3868 domain-containing protein [Alistipes sp.]